jgi:hypothetical protein
MENINALEQPCCTRDGGRPLGTALQEEVPNPLTLRRSRAWVVSGEDTAGQDPVRWGPRRRAQANCRGGVESVGTTSKPGGSRYPGSSLGGTCLRPRWRPA